MKVRKMYSVDADQAQRFAAIARASGRAESVLIREAMAAYPRGEVHRVLEISLPVSLLAECGELAPATPWSDIAVQALTQWCAQQRKALNF